MSLKENYEIKIMLTDLNEYFYEPDIKYIVLFLHDKRM